MIQLYKRILNQSNTINLHYAPSMMSHGKTPWKDPQGSFQLLWGQLTWKDPLKCQFTVSKGSFPETSLTEHTVSILAF